MLPAWSPDGQAIAVTTTVAEGNQAIALVNSDGGLARVISHPPAACNDLYATWSPDGQRVAFSRECTQGFGCGIYTVRSDGTRESRIIETGPSDTPCQKGRAVTHGVGAILGLDWSPDGQRLAFGNLPASGDGPLVELVGIDGSGLHGIGRGQDPAWAPDGIAIAAVRLHAIDVLDTSGRVIRRVVSTGGREILGAAWSR